MAPSGVSKGFQQGRGFADSVSQRGPVKIKAFAIEDLALAVKRQVIGIFSDQNLRQQARPRAATLDGPRGQRGLDEPFTLGAGQARSHDPVHDEAAGDVFQLLGHILADPAQAAAAIGTGIGAGALFHFHPWNVIGDRTTLGLVLLLDVWQLHPRGHRGGGDLAGLKRQLQLFRRLGRRPEPVRPAPGQLVAQLLDQDGLRLYLGQMPRGEAAQLLGVFGQG